MNLLFVLLLLCPCPVARNKHGKILRSRAAIAAFKRQSGYPKGRSGYVIDHVIPLCACGPDIPANMQWQRADSAKMKDKIEVQTCVRLTSKVGASLGATPWPPWVQ